jgi:hypothetical protein
MAAGKCPAAIRAPWQCSTLTRAPRGRPLPPCRPSDVTATGAGLAVICMPSGSVVVRPDLRTTETSAKSRQTTGITRARGVRRFGAANDESVPGIG